MCGRGTALCAHMCAKKGLLTKVLQQEYWYRMSSSSERDSQL